MIEPIPLYLDRNDIMQLKAIFTAWLPDMNTDDIIIISQNNNLDKIFVSEWGQGLQSKVKIIE